MFVQITSIYKAYCPIILPSFHLDPLGYQVDLAAPFVFYQVNEIIGAYVEQENLDKAKCRQCSQ